MELRLGMGAYVGVLLSAIGCTSSSRGVPALDVESLVVPRFPGIEPKTLTVVVEDKRSPAVDDGGEAAVNVQSALRESLKKAGFGLKETSQHGLVLMIESADQGLGELSNDTCIQIRGRLHVDKLGTTEALGVGCYEYRHVLGFSLGGGATEAYRTAINLVLRQFDRQLDSVRRAAKLEG